MKRACQRCGNIIFKEDEQFCDECLYRKYSSYWSQPVRLPQDTTLINTLSRLTLCLILLLSTATIGTAWAESAVSMPAIAQIESSNRADAVGDGGKALGLYQLHEAVVIDYNRHHKTSYIHQDALNPKIAFTLANWYANQEIPRLLRHFRLQDTLEHRLTAYNMGIGAVLKGKKAGAYIKKYSNVAAIASNA